MLANRFLVSLTLDRVKPKHTFQIRNTALYAAVSSLMLQYGGAREVCSAPAITWKPTQHKLKILLSLIVSLLLRYY